MTLCMVYYTSSGEKRPSDIANLGLEWTNQLMSDINIFFKSTKSFGYLSLHMRKPVYENVLWNFKEEIYSSDCFLILTNAVAVLFQHLIKKKITIFIGIFGFRHLVIPTI